MPSKELDLLTRLSVGWVSLNQCAKAIGVSYPTIQRLRAQGRIRITPVGGVFRVYADELKRLLTEGTADIVAAPGGGPLERTVSYDPDIDPTSLEEEHNG